MHRSLLFCCLLFALPCVPPLQAQQTFLFGGYRMGKYLSPEGTGEVYAAKFNLGWEFSRTSDDALIFFSPTSTEYEMTKYMEYGNLPQGISFGGAFGVGDYVSIEAGFHRFSQKYTGKRINLSDNSEETFTLQSRTGGLAFNILLSMNERFMPFIGLDFGHFRFRYSYEATGIDIEKQSIGYNVKLSGSVKPGAKIRYLGVNYGMYIRLVHLDAFDLKLVPQYQARLDSSEEIFRGLYQNHEFHHDNWSISLLLTKDLDI